MSLEIKALACGYGKRTVIGGIDLAIKPGEVLCVLGPNGVGKTTFFKTVLGFLPRIGGQVFWKGRPLNLRNNKERAQVLAYVPQTHMPPYPYSVREVVVMGRAAHLKTFQNPTKADYELCDEMLHKLKIEHLSKRIYTRISGGERQMVLIARALVQQPALLLMDEPTSNLDYGNQVKVLKQVLDLASEGLVVVMTSHSPEHAAICATHVALFQADGSILQGKPEKVISEEVMRRSYGVDVKLFEYEDGRGRMVKACAPLLN